MRSNNRVTYRIIIKDKKGYFKIGNIVIQKNEGDFYYIPSQRLIINSSFGLIQKIIDHFSFHKTGRVNVKPAKGGACIVESGEGEIQPLTNNLRQEIQDIGFQEILRDTIIDVQNVPQQRKAIDVWNYFPHKVLGGISPAEKLLEHHNKTKK